MIQIKVAFVHKMLLNNSWQSYDCKQEQDVDGEQNKTCRLTVLTSKYSQQPLFAGDRDWTLLPMAKTKTKVNDALPKNIYNFLQYIKSVSPLLSPGTRVFLSLQSQPILREEQESIFLFV